MTEFWGCKKLPLKSLCSKKCYASNIIDYWNYNKFFWLFSDLHSHHFHDYVLVPINIIDIKKSLISAYCQNNPKRITLSHILQKMDPLLVKFFVEGSEENFGMMVLIWNSLNSFMPFSTKKFKTNIFASIKYFI